MSYNTKINYKEESHPWVPYIPANADKLILGTFPTREKNRGAFEFFYPNPKNAFWKLIFAAADLDLKDYLNHQPVDCRKMVLEKLHLGIADMGKVICRQKENSNDENLFPLEFTDIFSLLEQYKNIRTIIVTSSTGNSNVLSWLHQYCILNGNDFDIPGGTLPKKTAFTFQNRKITVKIIPSPSPQPRIKGEKLIEMYKQAINDKKQQSLIER